MLGIAAVVWVMRELTALLVMVFVALFLAVGLVPAVDWLEKKGWGRRWATAAVFAVALVLVVVFLATLLPLLISQAAEIAVKLPDYLATVEDWLGQYLNVDLDGAIRSQLTDIGALIEQYGGRLTEGALAVGGTLATAAFQVMTVLLFAFYIVADTPRMLRLVLSLFSARRQRLLLRIWEVSIEKTGGYIYSRLILAGLSAVITTVTLALLSVPYPVALGIWMGVISQFLPVVGTYVGGALPVFIALVENPITALWVLILIVAYQQVENLIISPRVTSRTMAVHPAVSVGAVIAGGYLMGAVGAVLSLPVVAIVQSLISTSLRHHELVVEIEDSTGREE